MTITKPATSLRLPWPPSVNAYWSAFALPGGRVIQSLTKRARMYRSEVAEAIRAQIGAMPKPYRGAVRIDVELRAPDRRRRDIDNHLKGILDSLTHAGVWGDDYQVDELTLRRGQLIAGGCANVLIAALDVEPETNPTAPHDP